MDSGTGDAAVPRTSAVRAGWMGLLTGRAGRAVFAAGTGTGTVTWAGQWTDARRAMGRLHRSGPRRPPESSPHSPGGSSSASNRRASRPSAAARAGSVACHAVAAVLVACAALFAAALPAQAQTTIWTATLNPLVTFSGDPVPLGCDNTSGATWQCSNSVRLSDDDFTDDGTTYAVTKFFSKDGVLTFRLDTGATAATQGLTLVIDSEEFVLKEADRINGAKTQWKWNNTTLGWTAGTDVAVSLVVTDAPATGQPTISGGGQVGKTLTAATDDIEDLDGLPTTPTFTYQWVRVDGSTDTDIPGAASETHTLTASDLGKQIKVTVSFTDSRGHAEGPLTSGAYPPNNGTVVAAVGPCPAVNDWCATMTVADDGAGFGYEFDKSGSLDDNIIEYGGKEIEVSKLNVVIQSTRERFFFESVPRVPLGTVITVGDLTLTTDAESHDGSNANKWDYNPGELPPDLVWSDGLEVRISLVLGSFPAEGAVTISGTAQVGQTLTADLSGITDTDGLTTATYTYQWLRVDADGVSNETNIGANAATYTPVAADVGKQIKVQVSFTDDRGHVETVTSDATVTVTGNGNDPALSIADASAAENEGHLLFEVTLSRSSRNVVKVDFETISGGTATEGVDYHARRIYTHVIPAGETTVQMGFALIEDAVAAAGETVMVRLSNARRVNAYGDQIKELDITRAEATGTITAPSTSTTNVPNLTIRIQDATGSEDSGWLLFKVKLSRKHNDLVCYDFETISGGTATEGTDYLKLPKATYWMYIGKKVDKPFVRIINDRVNESDETVKVKISNAHLCDDVSQTVSITRDEATGTITETSALRMDSSDDGDGDDALLARVGDVTPEAATAALFGGDALTGDQLAAMDQLGNRNGAYDLGDLLSWRARCGRDEVSCGAIVSATDAGSLPASPAMPPTKRNGRTPPRRRGGARAGRRSGRNMGGSVECVPQRRAMRSGAAGRGPGRHGPAVRRATGWIRALALGLVASVWGCGIGDNPVQPAQPDPGPLHVQLTVPPEARDIGAMLVVEGPGIDSLSAPGFELIQADEASSNRREAIIAGSLSTGPVLQVWVPDRRQLDDYRVTLMQVSGDDYGLEDLTQYGIMISR